jgi:hypothetical protein
VQFQVRALPSTVAVLFRTVSAACGNVAAPCQEVHMFLEVFSSKAVVVGIVFETAWAYLINRVSGMATSP